MNAGGQVVRAEGTDGRQISGTPQVVASWLVLRYGEHADAQGLSGPTVLVDRTLSEVARHLRGES